MQISNPLRLYHTLLAASGGLVLSFSLLFAHVLNQSLLSNLQLTAILAVFWLINLGFITVVVVPSLANFFKEAHNPLLSNLTTNETI